MNKGNVIYAMDKAIEWSIYILIFCLPFSKSIVEISITIAFFSWGCKKITLRDFSVKTTPLNMMLLVFSIVSFISIINADLKSLVIRSLFTKSLQYIILYFIVIETINSQTKLKNILKLALASAAIVMVDGYIQHYLTHVDLIRLYPAFKCAYPPYDRKFNFLGFPIPEHNFLGFPTGSFPFPNDLSAWMLMTLMPILYLFIWGRWKRYSRFALAAFLFPFSFLFYLANTRSAWLGFSIALALTLFIQNKKVIILILILALVVALPFLPKQKIENMLGFTSMQDRLYMWRIGWKIFLEHPIIGSGVNTFFLKFKEFREDEDKGKRGSYAHNGYLQLAAETGILGLSIFLLLISRAFFSAFKYIRENIASFYGSLALGLSAGLLAFLIHSFFDTNLQSLPLVTLFWFSLAILMGLTNYAREI